MSQLFEPARDAHAPEHHDVGVPQDEDLLPRRADRRQQRQAAKKRRRHRVTTIVLAVVGVVAVAAGVYFIALPLLQSSGGGTAKVTDYPGPGSGTVQVTINSGDSGKVIGQTLQDKGVVATAKAFEQAYRDNPDSIKIQAATYEMKLEMKASDAVTWLLNPKNQVQTKILVKEGQRSWEIYQTISDATGISVADIEAAAKDSAAIGLPSAAKGDPEGWLFPATYAVQPGDDATAILNQMVQKTIGVLNKYQVPEDQREDVLTKASIVERETRLADDRPKAARLIDNRLAAGMKLQMDSTVAYFTRAEGRVTTTKEERATDDPHNTYLHAGLPSGPISSPGEDSIKAVLNPADGTWMYMVTVNTDTGETKFATTEQEFLALKKEWSDTMGNSGSASPS